MPCKLIIRVSVDAGHIENLGFSHVTRLIEIFKAGKYPDIELWTVFEKPHASHMR